MPQGYYTIEQWMQRKNRSAGEWKELLHLPFGLSLTEAEAALENLGKPGLYRIVQMQRVIWAEKERTGLRMRKSHAASPAGLDGIRKMFERTNGRYPTEEIKAARRKQKRGLR